MEYEGGWGGGGAEGEGGREVFTRLSYTAPPPVCGTMLRGGP